jgi:CRP/FNR family transcriptional regulator, cyclic AMP receptor protein
MQTAQILQVVDIFSDLKSEYLEQVFRICKEETYRQLQVICEENSPSQEIFVILDGEVEILVNVAPDPDQQTIYEQIALLDRGATFGEVALVDQGLRSATARCASKLCRVLVIDRQDFMRLMRAYPELGFQIMTNLAGDLCFKIRRTNFIMREKLLYAREGKS